ncbi:MAG: DUF1643 domain-containing protein [Phycisphaerales bacterium]|nr:DUF1643 domain-containing protein [Phycisphaerales bacterium]
MRGWATFSDDGLYRYTLGRRWAPGGKRVCFCLLNPSTADARVLDPTLTRCFGYAKRWGFHTMDVCNIFALRSTDPKGLKKTTDPVGPDNDKSIVKLAKRADLVIVGWGTHASLNNRHEEVIDLLTPHCEPHCLAITKHGYPKHPLYLRGDLEPALFRA